MCICQSHVININSHACGQNHSSKSTHLLINIKAAHAKLQHVHPIPTPLTVLCPERLVLFGSAPAGAVPRELVLPRRAATTGPVSGWQVVPREVGVSHGLRRSNDVGLRCYICHCNRGGRPIPLLLGLCRLVAAVRCEVHS